MAITNEQLTEQLALDLGIKFINRRPYAQEVFKYHDIELLPVAAEDTIIGEIFEWETRNWRTKHDNIIGYIASTEKIQDLKARLIHLPKVNALIPDFEFSKKEIIDAGLKLPFFDLSFSGNVKNVKHLSVKINGIKRVRLTNIDEVGIEIASLLSLYAQNKTKLYRRYIKNNHIAEALYYAESVEIELEKETGVNFDVNFNVNVVNVEVNVDTQTEKKYKISYKNNHLAPFGANLKKGKELFG